MAQMTSGRELKIGDVINTWAGEPFPGLAPCPHCFESSGYASRRVSDTWEQPGWDEPDPTRPCPYCKGTGDVECETATLEDLDELAELEADLDFRKPGQSYTITQFGIIRALTGRDDYDGCDMDREESRADREHQLNREGA